MAGAPGPLRLCMRRCSLEAYCSTADNDSDRLTVRRHHSTTPCNHRRGFYDADAANQKCLDRWGMIIASREGARRAAAELGRWHSRNAATSECSTGSSSDNDAASTTGTSEPIEGDWEDERTGSQDPMCHEGRPPSVGQRTSSKRQTGRPCKARRERYKKVAARFEHMIKNGLRLPDEEDEALPQEIARLCPPGLLQNEGCLKSLRRHLQSLQREVSMCPQQGGPPRTEEPVLSPRGARPAGPGRASGAAWASRSAALGSWSEQPFPGGHRPPHCMHPVLRGLDPCWQHDQLHAAVRAAADAEQPQALGVVVLAGVALPWQPWSCRGPCV